MQSSQSPPKDQSDVLPRSPQMENGHQVALSIDKSEQASEQSVTKKTGHKTSNHSLATSKRTSLNLPLVDVVRCPVCKSSKYRCDFTRSGMALAILFFPLGLFFCILLTEKRCESCGFKA